VIDNKMILREVNIESVDFEVEEKINELPLINRGSLM